jgi:putative zinc finger/helix-turn-helix YgiT family protein
MNMFGFRCQECHEGRVEATTVRDYPVAFEHVPFVVDEAVIGICSECGEEYIDGKEYRRWRSLFERAQEEAGDVLSAQEIRGLRKHLGMTMTDFAALLGVTRQSLSYWEDSGRESPQSRVIDTLLRLVRESLHEPRTDVLSFLHAHATSLGMDIAHPTAPKRPCKPATTEPARSG